MIRSIKRKSLLLATLGVLFFAGPSSAQVIFGVQGAAAIPTGDLSDVGKVGFGATGSVGILLGSGGWMLKGEAGYVKFGTEDVPVVGPGVTTEEIGGSLVPIRVGLRKYWGESRRFFTGPNLGIYIPGSDFDDVDSGFGLGPQVGLRFPLGETSSLEVIAEFHTVFIDETQVGSDPTNTIDKISYFTIGGGITFGRIGR